MSDIGDWAGHHGERLSGATMRIERRDESCESDCQASAP